MKISQLKSNLQKIITSLNKLQMHRDNIIQDPTSLSSEYVEILKCQMNLENLFSNVELEPLHKIVSQLIMKKRKRLAKKNKIKQIYRKTTTRKSTRDSLPKSCFVQEENTLSTIKKYKQHNSKKYLALIECLETLHRLRGGGNPCKLTESFASIKSFWQSIEHNIKEDINDNSLAKRWDIVLFGGKSEVEAVPDLGNFLEKRHIWDSYLDNSNGSHIPIGWVCPKDDARLEWKQFLQPSNLI